VVVEAPLEGADRRPGGDEDGDVVEAHGPTGAGGGPRALVGDLVPRGPERGDGQGDLLGLPQPHGGGPVGGRAPEEQHLVAGVEAGAVGRQGGVGRLDVAVALTDEPVEHLVDPVEDGVDRPEVLAEAHHTVGAEQRPRAVPEGGVGAPEAVDRLLGVAHDQDPAGPQLDVVPARRQPVGVGGGEGEDELDLERIGVLELVDDQHRPPLGQRPPDRGVAPQQVAGQHQQVVEVEAAGAATLVGPIEREPDQLGRQPHDDP
jgi:hypothetical protein